MVNSYAEGGIASYGIGGKVKADMERLPTDETNAITRDC